MLDYARLSLKKEKYNQDKIAAQSPLQNHTSHRLSESCRGLKAREREKKKTGIISPLDETEAARQQGNSNPIIQRRGEERGLELSTDGDAHLLLRRPWAFD